MTVDDYIPLNASAVVPGKAMPLRSKDGENGKELPKRVKIFEWGENHGRTTGALIKVGAKTLEVLSANQEAQARDTVPLDYEHQSFPGSELYKEHPHHVAAHGQIEVIEGEGVFYTALSYTPSGEEFAPNYPDVSPVAFTDDAGNLIFIHSVALTHSGDVSNLHFAEALSAHLKPTPTTTPTMDDDKPTDKYKAMLISLLNLKPGEGEDEVSDEAIAAAISDKTAAMSAQPGTPDHSNVVALTARLDQMERDRLVDGATREGKVIPLSAEEIKTTSVAVLSSMISKLPAGEVRMVAGQRKEVPSDQVTALSADEKAVAKQLGLTEEEYRKGL